MCIRDSYTIVGSGIVGLNCALKLKDKYPKSKILVLEKGSLPQGASTKNAGFACFGSVSEIIDDLKNHSESEIISLIKKRKEGLKYLRNLIGDKNLNYKQNGGFEIFPKKDINLFEKCQLKLNEINKLLKPLFSSNFLISSNKEVDKKIIIGSVFFGAGWGLIGLCPGPAITSLALLNVNSVIFVTSMFAGFYIALKVN